MNGFKIIFLFLLAMEAGAQLANHGKPKEGNYSFGAHCFDLAIMLGLLYGAGFFN